MKLADREGRLSQWEELLDELQPRQLISLMAYYNENPWGEEREDKRQAVMTAAICSAMSLSGKTVEPNDLLKLLKPVRKTEKKQSEFVSPNAAAARFRQQYMR